MKTYFKQQKTKFVKVAQFTESVPNIIGPPMSLNWAYTNNGGKLIQQRIDSSHYIFKWLALVSGVQ